MNRKILIGIAGAAIALVVVASAAYAGPSLSATSSLAAQATTTATTQMNAAPDTRAKHPRKALRLAQGLIRVTADATGTKVQDVVAALNDGQSLSEYASAHGKTDADIIGAARTKLDDRLKQAVANGKLTQERADTLLRFFDAAAPRVLADQQLGDQLARVRRIRRAFGAGLVKATADVTGTAPKDVVAALKSGQSLAGYAQAHGKTAGDIIAKLREQGEVRLANMLEKARELIEKPGLGRGGSPTATPQAPNQ